MEFIFRKDDEKNFRKFWLKFTENDTFSGFYSLEWLDYMRAYSRFIVTDLSFAIEDGGRCSGIVPLFLEEIDGRKQMSYTGSWMRAPICENKKIEEAAFVKIDELAGENNATKIMLMVEPSWGLQSNDKYNFLQKYGYLDASTSTNVINLSPSEKELLNSMRHGHESLVKSSLKTFSVVVSDASKPDFELHEAYREMHRRDAGRVTRPIETFNLQLELLKKDRAALFCTKYGERNVAFGYFFHGTTHAYYGSGATDPDFLEKNGAFHRMMWEAITYYKNRGLKNLETGWQEFGLQVFDSPSEKEISISHFKRGFGGANIPLLRGIKYYDYATLKEDVEYFLKKASEAMKNGP